MNWKENELLVDSMENFVHQLLHATEEEMETYPSLDKRYAFVKQVREEMKAWGVTGIAEVRNNCAEDASGDKDFQTGVIQYFTDTMARIDKDLENLSDTLNRQMREEKAPCDDT